MAPELAAETGVVDQKEEEQQLELFKNSVKDVNENTVKAWDGEPPEGGKPLHSVLEVLTPLRTGFLASSSPCTSCGHPTAGRLSRHR